MRKLVDRVGQIFLTNENYRVEIVKSLDCRNYIIKFEDNHLQKCLYSNLVKGSIKNKNHKSLYGVGYIGVGKYSPTLKSSTLWRGILRRCYCPVSLLRSPTYKGCTVHSSWHNFQNFAKWYEENYIPVKYEDFHLDKDLLVTGNKIYGPETCCFVPPEVNHLFTELSRKKKTLPIGVSSEGSRNYSASISIDGKYQYLGSFKTIEEARETYILTKEKSIKRVASKYREYLLPELYNKLINYKFK